MLHRYIILVLAALLLSLLFCFSTPSTTWREVPCLQRMDYAYKSESVVLTGYDATYMELHYTASKAGRTCRLYLADVRFLPEFSDKNEGSAYMHLDMGRVGFGMTKSTGTQTGAVDGPSAGFLFDSKTGVVFNQYFEPAPFFINPRFAHFSGETLSISDKRLSEIALICKEIMETEIAKHFPD